MRRLTEALDTGSRLQFRSFAFKLLLIMPVSIVFAAQHQAPVLGAVAYFCMWFGLFSGFFGTLQQEKLNPLTLTAWDESAAFMGLAFAARCVAALAG